MHPQSIVHGMARLCDGALIAHVGHPDMRVPISYALTYPERAADRRAAARSRRGPRAHVRAARHRHVPVPRAGAGRGRDRRHGAVRPERRERGGGGRVPRRPDRLPRHRRAGGRRARCRAREPRSTASTRAPRRRRGPRRRRRSPGSGGMSYLVAILGLLALVFVHELGHFLAAKSVGARATKFYVGFPPALLKRRRGDTEYGIGAIPLGGYVKIVGMARPQPVDLWRVLDAADEAQLRRGEDVADELTPAVDALERALKAQRLREARPLVDDAAAAAGAGRRPADAADAEAGAQGSRAAPRRARLACLLGARRLAPGHDHRGRAVRERRRRRRDPGRLLHDRRADLRARRWSASRPARPPRASGCGRAT